MSWLDKYFYSGYKSVASGGTALPSELTLNFDGAGVAVADNPTTGMTDVTISGGGGSGDATSFYGIALDAAMATPSYDGGLTHYDIATNKWVFGGAHAVQVDAIGTAATPGLTLRNTTPATAIAPVQSSPAIQLTGQGWDTAGTTTRTVDAQLQVQPYDGLFLAEPTLTLSYRSPAWNSGAWTPQIYFSPQRGLLFASANAVAKLGIMPIVGAGDGQALDVAAGDADTEGTGGTLTRTAGSAATATATSRVGGSILDRLGAGAGGGSNGSYGLQSAAFAPLWTVDYTGAGTLASTLKLVNSITFDANNPANTAIVTVGDATTDGIDVELKGGAPGADGTGGDAIMRARSGTGAGNGGSTLHYLGAGAGAGTDGTHSWYDDATTLLAQIGRFGTVTFPAIIGGGTPYLGLAGAPGSGGGSGLLARASTGTIRLPYHATIYARNSADSGDVAVLTGTGGATVLGGLGLDTTDGTRTWPIQPTAVDTATTTTDATPTALGTSIAITDNTNAQVEVRVTGRDTANHKIFRSRAVIDCKRVSTTLTALETATQKNSTTGVSPAYDGIGCAADVSYATGTGSIVATVTGKAATTIAWTMEYWTTSLGAI